MGGNYDFFGRNKWCNMAVVMQIWRTFDVAFFLLCVLGGNAIDLWDTFLPKRCLLRGGLNLLWADYAAPRSHSTRHEQVSSCMIEREIMIITSFYDTHFSKAHANKIMILFSNVDSSNAMLIKQLRVTSIQHMHYCEIIIHFFSVFVLRTPGDVPRKSSDASWVCIGIPDACLASLCLRSSI